MLCCIHTYIPPNANHFSGMQVLHQLNNGHNYVANQCHDCKNTSYSVWDCWKLTGQNYSESCLTRSLCYHMQPPANSSHVPCLPDPHTALPYMLILCYFPINKIHTTSSPKAIWTGTVLKTAIGGRYMTMLWQKSFICQSPSLLPSLSLPAVMAHSAALRMDVAQARQHTDQ